MEKPVNNIRRVNGYTSNAYTYYPVVVIGAGESGIAMGARLRSVLGFDQFRIFERRAGIGGTWYTNRYPGIACDIPAQVYSFSFAPNPNWTTLHPSGAEILSYLHDVCERFHILDKIQLNADVRNVRWLEDVEEWEVTVVHLAPGAGDMTIQERKDLAAAQGEEKVSLWSETVRAKILVTAAGGFVEPKPFIDVPGLDSFQGEVIHAARCAPDIDVAGKDVIVVGTGCSAAQIAPELIKPQYNAKSVTQLMRSPPWVWPTPPPHLIAWWAKWMPFLNNNIPGWQWFIRKLMFYGIEKDFNEFFALNEKARTRRKEKAVEIITYMKGQAPKKYHEILTPDFELFCKRRVVDAGWLKSFQDDRLDLTTLPLTSVQPHGVTLGPGRHYPPMSRTDSQVPTEERQLPADTIIFANGYMSGKWIHPLEVIGKGGKSLHGVWEERGGPQAYLGTAMDGFPNFFIIFGPNTATGHTSVILASENMVNYSLKFIKPILQGEVRTYEVKEEAERHWTAEIQRELKNSVWMTGGCNSWYVREDGWGDAAYPRSQVDFTLRCMFPKWNDWNASYTYKGILMRRLRRGVSVLAVFSIIVAGCLLVPNLGSPKSNNVFRQTFGQLYLGVARMVGL